MLLGLWVGGEIPAKILAADHTNTTRRVRQGRGSPRGSYELGAGTAATRLQRALAQLPGVFPEVLRMGKQTLFGC